MKRKEKYITIAITMPADLVRQIDGLARTAKVTRSKVIRSCFEESVSSTILKQEIIMTGSVLKYLRQVKKFVDGRNTLQNVKEFLEKSRRKKKGKET